MARNRVSGTYLYAIVYQVTHTSMISEKYRVTAASTYCIAGG